MWLPGKPINFLEQSLFFESALFVKLLEESIQEGSLGWCQVASSNNTIHLYLEPTREFSLEKRLSNIRLIHASGADEDCSPKKLHSTPPLDFLGQ